MQIINTPAELAALCRELRERAGMTRQQLADALGVTHAQEISNAESPAHPSRFKMRKRILEHFGYEAREAFIIEKALSRPI